MPSLVYSLCPVDLAAFVLFPKLPCQVINESDLLKIFVLFFIDFKDFFYRKIMYKKYEILKLLVSFCRFVNLQIVRTKTFIRKKTTVDY